MNLTQVNYIALEIKNIQESGFGIIRTLEKYLRDCSIVLITTAAASITMLTANKIGEYN